MRADGSDQREPVTPLVRLLDRALRRLGDLGDQDEACRVAAEAWALLEGTQPREAQRLNGTLHYLTRQPRSRGLWRQRRKEVIDAIPRHRAAFLRFGRDSP